MLKLHSIADKEDGWIQVVSSMVNVIPMNNSLGPSVMTLLLDDCPLPSKVRNKIKIIYIYLSSITLNVISFYYFLAGFGNETFADVSTVTKVWKNTD